ncbi:tripartite tricarboxylate transporter substrate binding protein [Alphaproteobacteria bacterium]|jgi:tripartite-type tricarboxylate transporter receptor subunit TctC|nr:tripartite tricarboxylate transporter substrate binding protein [Alphaproteobacteria bacterium]|tara:strand:+ start:55 stop:996 length:942 start_codon:yes stop_codon:yes gene_type:complete
MNFKNLTKSLLIGLMVFFWSAASFADFPNKPIKLYIGYKAGGGTDTVGRVLAKVMGEELGQQVNIINRPGSGGCLAAMQVAKMKPDGYSLVMDPSSSVTWARHTNPKCKIKVSQLDYAGTIAQFNFGLVSHVSAPYNSIEEFVNWSKGKTVSYVVLSPGSKALMKYIAAEKGIKVNYVPTKGGADMIKLILGKQVDMSFSGGIHTRHPDKIKLIASVASYRHASAPNVKTLKESGIDIQAGAFHFVAGPKGIPSAVIAKLESAMKAASKHVTMKDISNKTKFPIVYNNSNDTAKIMKQQDESYRILTQKTGKM